ncbi:Cell differentiation protein rcd1 [Lodderomyces elongisporus]|uniref:Cell differentiation protein rcd1 n=1 Tax=Lodderomyces elongisporus (strain ATCC 11503 / CBS 2605 / JCM 1781 / NBRC 1676 / NRRL YB-4239) TaxID=379508 RepID=A5E5W7_LODEL|nr:Cell differentiation protein rcd1 [Lodderomyces elongisporus]EDK46825.1 cell differentiation protein rcd1 [Lodderomyces elongisporus NRRL YB-4239]WLF81346.1 Cell differentiation protein rcd1 [Lodderomyces elongisporus]
MYSTASAQTPKSQNHISNWPPPMAEFKQDKTNVASGMALNDDQIYQWITELVSSPNREKALLELGKKREQYDDLALVLWNSFGVITVLLEEIVSVYPYLDPPNLSASASNRVCNALALLQCVASNVQTRGLFLSANLPLYLYPFLSTNARQRSFEYLRLTSLGVIGALVKNDTPEVINFLLTTEIVPLCLNIMEISSELSKTVAIFILQKILLDDQGLNYVCTTFERFHTVASVLSKMVEQLSSTVTANGLGNQHAQQGIQGQTPQPSSSNSSGRLLKHVIRCYMRLSDNLEARKALANILPEPLRDGTFSGILHDDAATRRCLQQLLSNISELGV